MDDVLSAVDVDVADAIVRDALLGVLQKVTRIVVLNSHYHVLKHSDWVVVVDKGQIAGQGTYEEIVANAEFANFLQLDDDEENLFLPEEKDKEEKNKDKGFTCSPLRHKCRCANCRLMSSWITTQFFCIRLFSFLSDTSQSALSTLSTVLSLFCCSASLCSLLLFFFSSHLLPFVRDR